MIKLYLLKQLNVKYLQQLKITLFFKQAIMSEFELMSTTDQQQNCQTESSENTSTCVLPTLPAMRVTLDADVESIITFRMLQLVQKFHTKEPTLEQCPIKAYRGYINSCFVTHRDRLTLQPSESLSELIVSREIGVIEKCRKLLKKKITSATVHRFLQSSATPTVDITFNNILFIREIELIEMFIQRWNLAETVAELYEELRHIHVVNTPFCANVSDLCFSQDSLHDTQTSNPYQIQVNDIIRVREMKMIDKCITYFQLSLTPLQLYQQLFPLPQYDIQQAICSSRKPAAKKARIC